MQSHILPISNPNPASSSSSGMFPITSRTAGTMLFKSKDDMATTTRLLISPTFEDDKKIETRPLISRTLSYTETLSSASGGSSCYQQQQKRWRIASETRLFSLSGGGRRRSFRQDMGRAASDTYLLTRLSFKLLRYLGLQVDDQISCPWLLLIPGFLQVGYYYFYSSQVRRGIIYSDQLRNRYKAWGSLLGQQLSERDIIVACIDYRNFPQGTMSDMVKDASQGISFVCNKIAEYGGDPNRIYLMGQSAGAHIAACALLEQAIKEAGEGETTSWSVSHELFGLLTARAFSSIYIVTYLILLHI